MNDGKDHLAGLEDEALRAIHGRSLLVSSEWQRSELDTLLRLAEAFEQLDRRGVKLPLLEQELAYALFFDNSTRTKSAWAGAAARLGMHPVIVDGTSTQVEHGETAQETGCMLGMNAHALGVRHDKILGEGNPFLRAMLEGITSYLKNIGDERVVPMVNLQCDVDHPTQSLADLLWLRQRFGADLSGKKIVVSWAYSPSYAKPLSVPQALIMLLPRFGANVVLAHPAGYELTERCRIDAERAAREGGGSFTVMDNMSAAFADADVVYPKSWGPYGLMMERVAAHHEGSKARMADIEERCLAQNARFTSWICDADKMAKTKDGGALYMHCLPADIDAEVSREVFDRYRTQVAREANKKVYVIMAMLAGAKVPHLGRRLRELAGEKA